jgi:ABC-type Fe3+/spermidine/putrescine transport system ATPase subunit
MFIKIKNLSKKISDQIIFSKLNINVEQGTIISLVGPSGCGKTTFLRCMAGLEQVTSGTIELDGVDITETKAERRPVVLMFQQPLLFPHLTILENVTYGLKYQKHKVAKKERVDRGLAMLEKVELGTLVNRYPHQLSGGQQQRVALARALIMNPSLLLLDEPFSSLDPTLRASLRNWVRAFLKKEGVTAIFVTHDREEAMMIGDQMVVMKEGVFQQVGTAEAIYQQPANSLVAESFGEGIVLPIGFVRANKIMLSHVSKPVSSDVNVHRIKLQHKILKYGQTFYQVHISDLNQDVVVLATKLEGENESELFLSYKQSDVQLFNSK